MKNKILSLTLVLILIFNLISCDIFNQQCEITINNGVDEPSKIIIPYRSLVPDQYLSKPKRDGYVFDGWYLDKGYTRPFNIGAPIVEDISLYALWTVDVAKFVNKISTASVATNVFIAVYNGDIFGNPITSQGYTSGSGVVYKEDEFYYYVISNNHVVAKDNSVVIITDAFGNEYTAGIVAKDKNYDLAVLRIRKTVKQLPLVTLADKNPTINTTVASLGNPHSQKNTVTVGQILEYKAVDVAEGDRELTNIDFEVLWHTCPTDNGSSGGAVLDAELRLVGINYGGIAQDKNNGYQYAIAVPIEKVIEFLIVNRLMP